MLFFSPEDGRLHHPDLFLSIVSLDDLNGMRRILRNLDRYPLGIPTILLAITEGTKANARDRFYQLKPYFGSEGRPIYFLGTVDGRSSGVDADFSLIIDEQKDSHHSDSNGR